ncbi:MAG: GNAT family N-acetyltransferase [Pseudomonadota bacterium]
MNTQDPAITTGTTTAWLKKRLGRLLPQPPHLVGAPRDASLSFRDERGRTITLAIVRSRDAFDALERSWNELYEAMGAHTPQPVFQSFNWHWHWCNHFISAATAPACPLRIVTVSVDGRTMALWPFVLTRAHGIKQLSLMGAPVSQYTDALARPDPEQQTWLALGLEHVINHTRADVVHVRKVRGDAVGHAVIAEAGASVLERQQAVSIDLAAVDEFETYLQRHSKRQRRNRRRQRRRLDERGTIAFTRVEPGDGAKAMVAQAIAMKRDWLQAKGLISPALADPRFDAFFADVASVIDRPTGTRAFALTCDDEIAAVEIAFDGIAHRAMHVIVYNPAYERCGVGALHMRESIERSHEEGIATFDLLAPQARYKSEWGDDLTNVDDLALACTRKGRLYLAVYLKRLRGWAKALAHSSAGGALLKRLGAR